MDTIDYERAKLFANPECEECFGSGVVLQRIGADDGVERYCLCVTSHSDWKTSEQREEDREEEQTN